VTTPETELLAASFEDHRKRLKAVAYRILGSASEADDALQEAFLRCMRTDAAGSDNLAGWLTTIVGRICLDKLRARRTRREVPVGAETETLPAQDNPEHEAMDADAVGLAMLVVLETLRPAERLAFVLHDMFDISFDEIGRILGCSPVAARQIASRARRRIRGSSSTSDADRARRRELVEAFLAASQRGDFAALLALLDPGVVVTADPIAVEASAARARVEPSEPVLATEIRGQMRVGEIFRGKARNAKIALIDGNAGLVFAPGGRAHMVVEFFFEQGRIVEIAFVAEPGQVSEFALEF